MSNRVTETTFENKPSKNASIGKKINYMRRTRNLTQSQLARKIGVTKKTIVEYEKAKDKIPLPKIKSISKALEVPADYLLGLSDIESYDITDNAIHNETGLSPKAIKILKYLKSNEDILGIINFLIEQEETFSVGFTPIVKENYTQEEYNEAFEKARIAYEQELEKWEKTHIPIISMICGLFTSKAKNEELYIINDSIKNEKDLEHKRDKFLATKIISNDTLVESAYLSEIRSYLKQAKSRYLKRREKQK